MSFLSSAKRLITGQDYDDEYDEYYDDEEYEEEKPRKRFFSFLSKKDDYDDYDEEYEEDIKDKYLTSRSTYKSSSFKENESLRKKVGSVFPKNLQGVEMSIITPTSFDDSSRIVKEVKNGKITVFDMSGINNVEEARRIVDYICGAAEGMDCPFSRICPSVFCIAPDGVVINGKKTRY
ncbi:MAG: cell division protein SepF [Clostridia bacterium]|nr:cell division protein SepF [Clostridia bacterium]